MSGCLIVWDEKEKEDCEDEKKDCEKEEEECEEESIGL